MLAVLGVWLLVIIKRLLFIFFLLGGLLSGLWGLNWKTRRLMLVKLKVLIWLLLTTLETPEIVMNSRKKLMTCPGVPRFSLLFSIKLIPFIGSLAALLWILCALSIWLLLLLFEWINFVKILSTHVTDLTLLESLHYFACYATNTLFVCENSLPLLFLLMFMCALSISNPVEEIFNHHCTHTVLNLLLVFVLWVFYWNLLLLPIRFTLYASPVLVEIRIFVFLFFRKIMVDLTGSGFGFLLIVIWECITLFHARYLILAFNLRGV